jgi:hypothetical protein
MGKTRDKTKELARDAEAKANRDLYDQAIARRDARTAELRALRLAQLAATVKAKAPA